MVECVEPDSYGTATLQCEEGTIWQAKVWVGFAPFCLTNCSQCLEGATDGCIQEAHYVDPLIHHCYGRSDCEVKVDSQAMGLPCFSTANFIVVDYNCSTTFRRAMCFGEEEITTTELSCYPETISYIHVVVGHNGACGIRDGTSNECEPIGCVGEECVNSAIVSNHNDCIGEFTCELTVKRQNVNSPCFVTEFLSNYVLVYYNCTSTGGIVNDSVTTEEYDNETSTTEPTWDNSTTDWWHTTTTKDDATTGEPPDLDGK